MEKCGKSKDGSTKSLVYMGLGLDKTMKKMSLNY